MLAQHDVDFVYRGLSQIQNYFYRSEEAVV